MKDPRELLEDAALVAAIQEGLKTGWVERERIFKLLTGDTGTDGQCPREEEPQT